MVDMVDSKSTAFCVEVRVLSRANNKMKPFLFLEAFSFSINFYVFLFWYLKKN